MSHRWMPSCTALVCTAENFHLSAGYLNSGGPKPGDRAERSNSPKLLRRLLGGLPGKIRVLRGVLFSGHVRPRQGTEICNFGVPSPLDFLRIFSSGFFFPFLQVYLLCNLVRKRPQNMEKIVRFPGGERGVESCHVCGCRGFFRSRFLSQFHRESAV